MLGEKYLDTMTASTGKTPAQFEADVLAIAERQSRFEELVRDQRNRIAEVMISDTGDSDIPADQVHLAAITTILAETWLRLKAYGGHEEHLDLWITLIRPEIIDGLNASWDKRMEPRLRFATSKLKMLSVCDPGRWEKMAAELGA